MTDPEGRHVAATTTRVRAAQPFDLPRIVELIEERRQQYEEYQPRFWRRAANPRGKEREHLEELLHDASAIVLVHDRDGRVDGVAVGVLEQAPPMYDPGGLTCIIDDFVVAAQDLWGTVGVELLGAMSRQARRRGAALAVVVSGHLDRQKRAILAVSGFSIFSEWYAKDIKP